MSSHGISSPSMRPAGCLIATAPMARPCAVAPDPDPSEILEGCGSVSALLIRRRGEMVGAGEAAATRRPSSIIIP